MKRGRPLARRTPLVARKPLTAKTALRRLYTPNRENPAAAEGRSQAPRKRPRDTGFSQLVKDAVRERAAHHCEACGCPVPPGYGNIQHRRARKMGGSRSPLISGIQNAVLLCGTPLTGCHGLAEKRDEHMHGMGIWLEEHEDPARVPIMFDGEYGGTTVWLTDDAWYSTKPPATAEREAS